MNKVIQLNDSCKTIIDVKYLGAFRGAAQPYIIMNKVIYLTVVVGFEKLELSYYIDYGQETELYEKDCKLLKKLMLKKYK